MALIYITKVADSRAKIAPMRIKQAKKRRLSSMYNYRRIINDVKSLNININYHIKMY